MTTPLLPRAVMVSLAITTAATCDSTFTGPETRLRGPYELLRLDEDSLPAMLWREEDRSYWLIRDELLFDGEGGVTRTFTTRIDSTATGRQVSQPFEFHQVYWIRGDSLEIGWPKPCPPNANCIGNELGTIAGSALVLTSSVYYGHRLTYQPQ